MNIEQAKHIINGIMASEKLDQKIATWCFMNNKPADLFENPEKAPKDNDLFITAIREGRKLIEQAQVLYDPLDEAKVGDGITHGPWTDKHAFTIISRTPTKIVAQEDKATLLNGDELVFHSGGFSAHCSNQHIQKYSYEADPDGLVATFTRRKNGKWLRKGENLNATQARIGRHKFYDYNY